MIHPTISKFLKHTRKRWSSAAAHGVHTYFYPANVRYVRMVVDGEEPENVLVDEADLPNEQGAAVLDVLEVVVPR